MRIAAWAMISMVAGGLTACGSKESTQSAAQPAAAPTRGESSSRGAAADATAAEVAAQARGKLKCPPKVQMPPRDAKAPVDDVLGVRPGMSYEDAANVVMCTHDLLVVQPDARGRFQIQTYGQSLRQGFSAHLAAPRVGTQPAAQKTARDYRREMQDKAIAVGTNRSRGNVQPTPGTSWYVTTMGLPGQERVINAAREERFEEGRNPTIASIEQALIQKYGKPTQATSSGAGRHLRWAYDTLGRQLTETSPRFNTCHGTADPNGAASYSPDCGIVVQAHIEGMRENPQISQFMRVGVIDQAGGYEAVERTEQAFQQMEMQRRAQQVQDAQNNVDAPSL